MRLILLIIPFLLIDSNFIYAAIIILALFTSINGSLFHLRSQFFLSSRYNMFLFNAPIMVLVSSSLLIGSMLFCMYDFYLIFTSSGSVYSYRVLYCYDPYEYLILVLASHGLPDIHVSSFLYDSIMIR